jgi:hypothetical protein
MASLTGIHLLVFVAAKRSKSVEKVARGNKKPQKHKEPIINYDLFSVLAS